MYLTYPMKNTIGDIISRVRKQIKALHKDAFVTDRFIYSLVKKHASWLMRREDGRFKLAIIRSLYETLEYVELIEVDKIQAGCTGLRSGCTIKRTKDKLDIFLEGYHGPLIRSITSIDGSDELTPTTPTDYIKITNSKNFKYNKTKYYWVSDHYIYFPNIEWDAVRIEGAFNADISDYTCDQTSRCKLRQEQAFNVPEFLHAEIESHVLRDDLLVMYQVPSDPIQDKQSPAR